MAHKLRKSAAAMIRHIASAKSGLSLRYKQHRALSLLLSKCINKWLRNPIISLYTELCHHVKEAMFA